MNCPECGSQSEKDQQFCRNCGHALVVRSSRRKRFQTGGFLVVLLMFVGLMLSMAGKMVDVRPLVFAGAFIAVGSGFLMVLGMFLYANGPIFRRQNRRESDSPDTLEKAKTTSKLPPVPAADHFRSVTEETTGLLTAKDPDTPRSISI